MSTPEERQMIGHLRHMTALMQAEKGAPHFTPVLEKGTGNRDTGKMVTTLPLSRIILSVYSLTAPAAPPPAEGDKPAPKTAPAKASVLVQVFGCLNDTERVLIVSDIVLQVGQVTIELPYISTNYAVAVTVEGTAEYAVFAI